MALIRVFLLTYRRPVLLRRALRSLLAQSCRDWVCELHNDAPDDSAPAQILAELAPGDPRISYHHHATNWGALKSFNHAFAGSPEPFTALLEDDNWWEPGLLAALHAALEADPAASMVWANMRIWRELADGGWENTGETIWPVVNRPRVSIAWPQLMQFDTALHSNGAMLVRTPVDGRLYVPPSTPFDAMESLRERAYDYPLLFLPQPLANFALTRQTARSSNVSRWAEGQAAAGAAYLRHARLTPAQQSALWDARRTARPPATSGLIVAALLERTPGFLRHATLADWGRFVRGAIRRPGATLAALRTRTRQPELWAQFDRASAKASTRAQPKTDIGPGQLSCRADLARIFPD